MWRSWYRTCAKEYGGTAGNIAYNLKLLGGDPMIMATVGDDFGPYRERLAKLEIPLAHVRGVPGAFMAQAFITTDLDANQITAFPPWRDGVVLPEQGLGCAGHHDRHPRPDSRDGMLQHASQFHDLGIPFIFDPGQALPVFNGDELRHFIELSDYVAVNDYEARVLEERTGEPLSRLTDRVKAFFVTKGAEGSVIYAEGQQISVPSVKENRRVDPTGL